jgi:hypothetical protein
MHDTEQVSAEIVSVSCLTHRSFRIRRPESYLASQGMSSNVILSVVESVAVNHIGREIDDQRHLPLTKAEDTRNIHPYRLPRSGRRRRHLLLRLALFTQNNHVDVCRKRIGTKLCNYKCKKQTWEEVDTAFLVVIGFARNGHLVIRWCEVTFFIRDIWPS